MLARASRRARAPARSRSPIAGAFASACTAPDSSGIALRASAFGAVAAPFRCRVTRRCTMLRMSALAPAPITAHRPQHFRRRDCRWHCRRCRQSARHGASHRCPRSRRRGRPLTRRGGSPPPGSPASIPRSPVQHESGIDRPGPGLGFTPDASLMQGLPWLPVSAVGCPCRGPAYTCPFLPRRKDLPPIGGRKHLLQPVNSCGFSMRC